MRHALTATAWLSVACAGATPRPSPALPLAQASVAATRREVEGCERVRTGLDTPSVGAWDVDLDGDGASERVVCGRQGGTVLAVLDRACARELVRATLPAWSALDDAGPTLPSRTWPEVSAAALGQMASTDRVGFSPEETSLHVVDAGAGFRYVALVAVGGGPEVRQRGWRATVVGCAGGRCRVRALGHVEWVSVPDRPASPEAPVRVSLSRRREPLLFVQPDGGALRLSRWHRTYVARGEPGPATLWREERFDARE